MTLPEKWQCQGVSEVAPNLNNEQKKWDDEFDHWKGYLQQMRRSNA